MIRQWLASIESCFQLSVESHLRLLRLCLTAFSDWLNKLANESDRDFCARVTGLVLMIICKTLCNLYHGRFLIDQIKNRPKTEIFRNKISET